MKESRKRGCILAGDEKKHGRGEGVGRGREGEVGRQGERKTEEVAWWPERGGGA